MSTTWAGNTARTIEYVVEEVQGAGNAQARVNVLAGEGWEIDVVKLAGAFPVDAPGLKVPGAFSLLTMYSIVAHRESVRVLED